MNNIFSWLLASKLKMQNKCLNEPFGWKSIHFKRMQYDQLISESFKLFHFLRHPVVFHSLFYLPKKARYKYLFFIQMWRRNKTVVRAISCDHISAWEYKIWPWARGHNERLWGMSKSSTKMRRQVDLSNFLFVCGKCYY